MTEHDHAVKVFEWAQAMQGAHPELETLFHIPNGGWRHPSTAVRLKAEGVRAGVPDYCLPSPSGRFNGLFLELKKPGGKMTPEQHWWVKRLIQHGYAAGVCSGSDHAIEILSRYLGVKA